MDAQAYLRNQGWRGDGHSLDHTDRGIKKPLLISKKVDVLGLGLNKHKAVSDQWWMRAFDQGLKALGTGQESALAQVQKHGVNRGGLYANFVKGERFEGSIGNIALPTPEDSEGGETAEKSKVETGGKMSTKRKRDTKDDEVKERPKEKRARRARERDEKKRLRTAEKRVEERQKAIADGTYDEEAEAEKIVARQREREVNQKAKDIVLDAQRKGIIPHGPNEVRKGLIPTGANAEAQGPINHDLKAVLEMAGIDPAKPVTVSGTLKAQKYARLKVQREVKRAAKAYLMGEELLPLPESKDERKRLRREERRKNAASEAERTQKNAERMQVQAEKSAAKSAQDLKRKTSRERRRDEKTVIDAIVVKREALKAAEDKVLRSQKIDPAGFDNDADEIKLGLSKKGTLKKIPGVGAVDKYPSSSEKKAKKQLAEDVRAELGEAELFRRVQEIRAAKFGIDLDKLEQYEERAAAKGLTLSEYVQRRQQKKKELDETKAKEKLVEKWKGVEGEVIIDDSKLPQVSQLQAENGTLNEDGASDQESEDKDEDDEQEDGDAPMADFGFVIDTAGDEKLEFKVKELKDGYKNKTKPTEFISDLRDAQINNISLTDVPVLNPKTSQPTNLATKAIAAISEDRPFTVHDPEGNTSLHWTPGTPIPIDARIWEGVVVKDLPRKVRDARKQWLVLRREERKKAQDPNYRKIEKKARSARKIEDRERFLTAILHASRAALLQNGKWGGYADLRNGRTTAQSAGEEDLRANVPLVQIETTEGKFSKFETSLARTVARRIQRDEKRAERAKEGKGKGWKKRKRSEKQARIERGISGFVDRWRNG